MRSELLRIALEEQWGSMERDTLSGTITPKAGRALAVPGLSCPHPFSHLILVLFSFSVPPSSEKEQ